MQLPVVHAHTSPKGIPGFTAMLLVLLYYLYCNHSKKKAREIENSTGENLGIRRTFCPYFFKNILYYYYCKKKARETEKKVTENSTGKNPGMRRAYLSDVTSDPMTSGHVTSVTSGQGRFR